eukprot:g65691.t1
MTDEVRPAPAGPLPYLLTLKDPGTTERTRKREIGDEAVWTLSSAKPGNGVEQLRDNNVETFWQSDGENHHINIQFHKKTRVKEIAFYLDFKHDESYTPAKISIRAGSVLHDLSEIANFDLKEPVGWVVVPLETVHTERDLSSGSDYLRTLRVHLLQLAVLASHQSGRDTHIRQVKIFGPRKPMTHGWGTELSEFNSLEFLQVRCIR